MIIFSLLVLIYIFSIPLAFLYPRISRRIQVFIILLLTVTGVNLKFFDILPFRYLLIYLIVLLIYISTFKVNIRLSKENILFYVLIVSMIASMANALNLFNSVYYIILFTCGFLLYHIFFKINLNLEMKFLEYYIFFIYFVFVCFSVIQKYNFNMFMEIIDKFYSLDFIYVIEQWTYSNRVVGFGVHPGVNALIITMLGFLVCYFAKNIYIYILVGLLNTTCIIWTGNRSVLIIFAIMFISGLVFQSLFGKYKLFKVSIGLIAIVIGLYLINTSEIIERFGIEGSSSIESRFYLYKFAFNLFLENPLFGSGINNYAIYTEAVGGVGLLKEVTQAHNIFLQIMAELGLFGLFSLLLLILVIIKIDITLIKSLFIKNKISLLYLYYSSAIFMLNSLTANPTYIDSTFLLFMIVRGLITNNYKNLNDES